MEMYNANVNFTIQLEYYAMKMENDWKQLKS